MLRKSKSLETQQYKKTAHTFMLSYFSLFTPPWICSHTDLTVNRPITNIADIASEIQEIWMRSLTSTQPMWNKTSSIFCYHLTTLLKHGKFIHTSDTERTVFENILKFNCISNYICPPILPATDLYLLTCVTDIANQECTKKNSSHAHEPSGCQLQQKQKTM